MRKLLVLISIYMSLIVGQTLWVQGQTNDPEIKTTQLSDNLLRFRLVNLPLVDFECPEEFHEDNYNYFWYFGDGAFSQEKMPEHEFHASGTYVVRVEANPIYGTEEPPVIFADTTIVIQNVATNLRPRQKMRTGRLNLAHNRPLMMDNYITFILSHNEWNRKQKNQEVRFLYDTTSVDFVEAIPMPTSGANSGGVLKWDIDQTGHIDSTKNIFVKLKARDSTYLEQGDKLPFRYQLKNTISSYSIQPQTWPNWQGSGGTLEKDSLIVNDTLWLRVGKSFDPNMKEVNYSHISGRQRLRYRIHFQNLGDGFANRVFIEENIDEWLRYDPRSLISPITLTRVVIGEDNLPLRACRVTKDYANRKVYFELNGLTLPGTGMPGFDQCAAITTMGYVEYTINTIDFWRQGIPSGSVFGTYADIYFDDNGAIRTNTAYTRIDSTGTYCQYDEDLSNVMHFDTLLLYAVENNIIMRNFGVDLDTYSEFNAGNTITCFNNTLIQGNSLLRIDGCNTNRGSFKTENDQNENDDRNSFVATNELLQISPNPANQQAIFEYVLSEASPVRLDIFNLSGQLVKSLHHQEIQQVGQYKVVFDTSNLPNGFYLCKFQTKYKEKNIKLQVIR